MTSLLQASLPTREGLAAWAAAASTAGAILPGRVAHALMSHEWNEHGPQYNVGPDDLWDAFSVVEACCAAARSIYREDPSQFPMPRGMEVGIAPYGGVTLVWRSDDTVTLRFGGGWSTADQSDRGGPNQTPHDQPDMSHSVLSLLGKGDLSQSPRVLAAVAASPTLQQNGWG